MPSRSEERSEALERAEENLTLSWLCLLDVFEPGDALMVLHQMAAIIAAPAFVPPIDNSSLH